MKTFRISKTTGNNKSIEVATFSTLQEAQEEMRDILNGQLNEKHDVQFFLNGGDREEELIRWTSDFIESDIYTWKIEQIAPVFKDTRCCEYSDEEGYSVLVDACDLEEAESILEDEAKKYDFSFEFVEEEENGFFRFNLK